MAAQPPTPYRRRALYLAALLVVAGGAPSPAARHPRSSDHPNELTTKHLVGPITTLTEKLSSDRVTKRVRRLDETVSRIAQDDMRRANKLCAVLIHELGLAASTALTEGNIVSLLDQWISAKGHHLTTDATFLQLIGVTHRGDDLPVLATAIDNVEKLRDQIRSAILDPHADEKRIHGLLEALVEEERKIARAGHPELEADAESLLRSALGAEALANVGKKVRRYAMSFAPWLVRYPEDKWSALAGLAVRDIVVSGELDAQGPLQGDSYRNAVLDLIKSQRRSGNRGKLPGRVKKISLELTELRNRELALLRGEWPEQKAEIYDQIKQINHRQTVLFQEAYGLIAKLVD